MKKSNLNLFKRKDLISMTGFFFVNIFQLSMRLYNHHYFAHILLHLLHNTHFRQGTIDRHNQARLTTHPYWINYINFLEYGHNRDCLTCIYQNRICRRKNDWFQFFYNSKQQNTLIKRNFILNWKPWQSLLVKAKTRSSFFYKKCAILIFASCSFSYLNACKWPQPASWVCQR